LRRIVTQKMASPKSVIKSRIQVIQQKEPEDSKDSEDSEKTPKFDDGNSDKCDHCFFNDEVTEDTDSKFEVKSSFEFDKTYYWRARAEKPGPFGLWLSNIGKWSKVRQFKVIESPTAGGKYKAKCQEKVQPENGIDFEQKYNYTNPFKTKKFIYRTDAIAQICYPEGQNTPMPVVLFLHGDYENCYQTGEDCEKTDKETGKVAFFDWQGVFIKYAPDDVVQIISPMTCPTKDIFPFYKGFKYLQKELASHGLFTISISAHDIQGHKEDWIVEARSKLIVKFVEKLKAWNEKGTDLLEDIQIKGKLNLTKIGLIGHSRGGEAILAAAQSLRDDKTKKGPVVAMVAMAPNNEESHQPGDIPYYLLQGLRDNDMFALQGLVSYQHYENQAAPKMKALVYGANHNFFNQELKKDDGAETEYFSKSEMKAEEQREVTRTTITAFMRWHLLGEEKYQAILNGSYKHPRIFWAYDAGNNNLTVIDDFEQVFDAQTDGYGKDQNTLGGTNSFSGKEFNERILYTFPNKDKLYQEDDDLTWDPHFFEQTVGIRLKWDVTTQGTTRKTTAIYRTNYRIVPNEDNTLPPPPVSNWRYLSLLAANVVPSGKEEPKIFSENQTSISLGVTLETKTGETEEAKRSQTVNSSALARIPHPYHRTWDYCRDPDLEGGLCIDNEQAVLTGIRIPLAEFGLEPEELNNLTAIEIEVDALGNSEGYIALDDIFFTQ